MLTLSLLCEVIEDLMNNTKTYLELSYIGSYEDRVKYLLLGSDVGEDTFGFDRYLNQRFYKSQDWLRVRNEVIVRDNGCDLGHSDHPIAGLILIHHIVPITKDDVIENRPCLLDPNNLISVSQQTHNLIHYGHEVPQSTLILERRPNDTCPWKKVT